MSRTTKELARDRVALLLQQVQDDGLASTPRAAAIYIGMDVSYASKIEKKQRASVGLTVLEAICEKMRLDKRFFSDESPVDPDYKRYLKSSLDRDSDVGTPNVEAAISAHAKHGTPLLKEVITVLRGWRSKTGDFSPSVIEAGISTLTAEVYGKVAKDRPELE